MYFATAEQQHHSVELSDKTMLVKSKVSFIHSTAVKKKNPANSVKNHSQEKKEVKNLLALVQSTETIITNSILSNSYSLTHFPTTYHY